MGIRLGVHPHHSVALPCPTCHRLQQGLLHVRSHPLRTTISKLAWANSSQRLSSNSHIYNVTHVWGLISLEPDGPVAQPARVLRKLLHVFSTEILCLLKSFLAWLAEAPLSAGSGELSVPCCWFQSKEDGTTTHSVSFLTTFLYPPQRGLAGMARFLWGTSMIHTYKDVGFSVDSSFAGVCSLLQVLRCVHYLIDTCIK